MVGIHQGHQGPSAHRSASEGLDAPERRLNRMDRTNVREGRVVVGIDDTLDFGEPRCEGRGEGRYRAASVGFEKAGAMECLASCWQMDGSAGSSPDAS